MRKVLLASIAIWGSMVFSCSPEKMPDVSPIAQNQGGGQNQQNNDNQQDNQGQETTPTISVSPSSLSFEASSSSKTVSVTSNVEWDFSCSDTWLSATKSGSSLSVSVTANQSVARTSTIYLRQQGQASNLATINVSQEGASSSSASDNTYTVNGVSFKMIRVEGGTFMMGATSEQGDDATDNERPVHQVTLSSYYISETEVTEDLWAAVMAGVDGYSWSWLKGSLLPKGSLCFNDAIKFVEILNRLTNNKFRLPTEAEWEFAARGGNKSRGYKYSGSNKLDEVAWFWDNSKTSDTSSEEHDVATKKANELGIYDMSGSMNEFCQDIYGLYSAVAQTNPTGAKSGKARVLRGGAFNFDTDPWDYFRVSARNPHFWGDSLSDADDFGSFNYGIRLVLSN